MSAAQTEFVFAHATKRREPSTGCRRVRGKARWCPLPLTSASEWSSWSASALRSSASAQPKIEVVKKLKPIAEEAGLTMPQFALAWVLREPNVASAIIGASRPQQVVENAEASGAIIDTQLFVRAERIIEEALAAQPA